MLTTKDDYSYIQVFIDYLKQIIDLLIKLFRGSDDAEADAPAEDA